MTRSGEFDWISTYLAPLAADNSFGLIDDAALLDVPDGKSLIITQDAIAAGIHFLPDDPVDLIARKALRVNVSDIVAKGGRPNSYSLALGVPDTWRDADIALFAEGLATDQKQYELSLTGGDTYRSPDRLCVAVTMFSIIDRQAYKSRLGARAGDLIYVTGTIGDSAMGLKIVGGDLSVNSADQSFLSNACRLPDPPLTAADVVAQMATASMDISDGLMGDCRKLCAASKVGAVIHRDKVPVSDAVDRLLAHNEALWPSVLTGGDDYQILCTIVPDNATVFQQALAAQNVKITHIGAVKSSNIGAVILDIGGVEVSIGKDSYSHF